MLICKPDWVRNTTKSDMPFSIPVNTARYAHLLLHSMYVHMNYEAIPDHIHMSLDTGTQYAIRIYITSCKV